VEQAPEAAVDPGPGKSPGGKNADLEKTGDLFLTNLKRPARKEALVKIVRRQECLRHESGRHRGLPLQSPAH